MAPVILLLAFCCTLLLYLYSICKQRPANFPPGPPRLPVWGSYWLLLLKNFKFLHIGFHKLAQKYNTKILGLYLGSFPAVVVNDYKNIREVLTRPEFQGRVKLFILNLRTYNKNLGITLADDGMWENQRRFSLRHMRDFGFGRRFAELEDIGKEEIQDMLDLLNGRREDKEVFSDGLALAPGLFYPVFFNALWFIISGHRFPINEHQNLRYFTRQALRFVRSIDVTGSAVVQTPWIRHVMPYYCGFTDLMEGTSNILKYIKEAVTEHKATYSEEHMRDFIDVYLKEMSTQKTQEASFFSEEQLHVVCMDFLIPAIIVTTSILSFSIAFLLNYPAVQTKMQQELDTEVGRDRLPSLDDRARLPYNEAFLREVMRKVSIVPMAVGHRATEDTQLSGYNIPKVSSCTYISKFWSSLYRNQRRTFQ
ncbi:hypothetical protein B7P43_G16248 [Cryptotermes secundus]|uniref:Cytochrome P450 304a1 n=1 Tax=Cryptotermes secundus TaxID=105785 RepID=A0A2J7QUQ4_9NEOP|nr:hypothetical protein B7P43_G16248 [Cryptotermes secundus]